MLIVLHLSFVKSKIVIICQTVIAKKILSLQWEKNILIIIISLKFKNIRVLFNFPNKNHNFILKKKLMIKCIFSRIIFRILKFKVNYSFIWWCALLIVIIIPILLYQVKILINLNIMRRMLFDIYLIIVTKPLILLYLFHKDENKT